MAFHHDGETRAGVQPKANASPEQIVNALRQIKVAMADIIGLQTSRNDGTDLLSMAQGVMATLRLIK